MYVKSANLYENIPSFMESINKTLNIKEKYFGLTVITFRQCKLPTYDSEISLSTWMLAYVVSR